MNFPYIRIRNTRHKIFNLNLKREYVGRSSSKRINFTQEFQNLEIKRSTFVVIWMSFSVFWKKNFFFLFRIIIFLLLLFQHDDKKWLAFLSTRKFLNWWTYQTIGIHFVGRRYVSYTHTNAIREKDRSRTNIKFNQDFVSPICLVMLCLFGYLYVCVCVCIAENEKWKKKREDEGNEKL